MKPEQLINRTNNLIATVILTLAGFAFFPEVIVEDKPEYKLDDGFLFWLGIGSIIWYLIGKNKFKRTIMPVIGVSLGLLIKLVGVILEIKDKDDVGDDFGGLILFIIAFGIVLFLHKTSKKILTAK